MISFSSIRISSNFFSSLRRRGAIKYFPLNSISILVSSVFLCYFGSEVVIKFGVHAIKAIIHQFIKKIKDRTQIEINLHWVKMTHLVLLVLNLYSLDIY
jgi:hypothetical protein